MAMTPPATMVSEKKQENQFTEQGGGGARRREKDRVCDVPFQSFQHVRLFLGNYSTKDTVLFCCFLMYVCDVAG